MRTPSPDIGIRVAFAGAGYMATEHARAFRAIDGVKLVGVYSRSTERATAWAQEQGVETVAASLAELYERTRPEILVISVRELGTASVCAEAFQFPWLCLVEKPAGYCPAVAAEVIAAAERFRARAFVALNRRHYGSTRRVLAELPNHPGRRLIHVQDQEEPRAALASGQPEEVVRNWMYANSIHLVDYFSILGRGRIVEVTPIVPWNPIRPDYVVARIAFDSGDIGLYQAVWDAPGPWAVSVTTAGCRWEMRPLEQAARQVSGSRKLEPLPADDWDREFKPGLREQAEQVIRAFRGESHTLPSLRTAAASMRLVEQIYQPELRDQHR